MCAGLLLSSASQQHHRIMQATCNIASRNLSGSRSHSNPFCFGIERQSQFPIPHNPMHDGPTPPKPLPPNPTALLPLGYAVNVLRQCGCTRIGKNRLRQNLMYHVSCRLLLLAPGPIQNPMASGCSAQSWLPPRRFNAVVFERASCTTPASSC